MTPKKHENPNHTQRKEGGKTTKKTHFTAVVVSQIGEGNASSSNVKAQQGL